MNSSKINLPYYASLTIKLLMIICLGFLLVYGKNFFVPLVFAILFAILLLPVSNFFEKSLHFSKALAATTCIFVTIALVFLLIYLLSYQISSFVGDIPSIKSHLLEHYNTLTAWVQNKFHINKTQQNNWLSTNTSKMQEGGLGFLRSTVYTMSEVLFFAIMIAIYAFFILLYRHNIKTFLLSIFSKASTEDVTFVLGESKAIVQHYIWGLLIDMVVVAIANTTLLLIIGVKYAVFLGILSAILNLIPYVGIASGMIITCLVTLTTTSNLSHIMWIVGGYYVIHFIDSNFLAPKIVGSKVSINPLITILGVVVGGTLLGLPGIFLALPVMAILKIIFERVDELKPWAILMGNEQEKKNKGLLSRKKKQ